jgi:hypothetical protein
MINLQQTTPIVTNFPWLIIAWAVLAIFFVVVFGGVMKRNTEAEQSGNDEDWNEKGDL